MGWLFPMSIGQELLRFLVISFSSYCADIAYQFSLFMRRARISWSDLLVTIKLVRVAPNDLSRIDDHAGLSNLMWFPIGPTGFSRNLCSLRMACNSFGMFWWNAERCWPRSLIKLPMTLSHALISALLASIGKLAWLSSCSAVRTLSSMLAVKELC
jgi:hypothetical protein